ncbi:helix-turn-helix domain-containing protein [Streptomyces sp. NPDC012751]|uniref:helix-turn-helix domain-containing protein n=1 Tax=Streptomyces sp. NPDC012751 TaxID=3364846 RepID=UPI00368731FF
MARPERPLNCLPRRHALAGGLRAIRAQAGVTYADLAEHTGRLSPATLKRVASDVGGVPKWANVEAYYHACLALSGPGGSAGVSAAGADLHRLWCLARREERGTLAVRTLAPGLVRDKADLGYALYALYEHQGAPALRELQQRAGGALHLPLSTAARIVTRQALPADTQQYQAFLAGCGAATNGARYKEWLAAWYKVMLFDVDPEMRQYVVDEQMTEATRRAARRLMERTSVPAP